MISKFYTACERGKVVVRSRITGQMQVIVSIKGTDTPLNIKPHTEVDLTRYAKPEELKRSKSLRDAFAKGRLEIIN